MREIIKNAICLTSTYHVFMSEEFVNQIMVAYEKCLNGYSSSHVEMFLVNETYQELVKLFRCFNIQDCYVYDNKIYLNFSWFETEGSTPLLDVFKVIKKNNIFITSIKNHFIHNKHLPFIYRSHIMNVVDFLVLLDNEPSIRYVDVVSSNNYMTLFCFPMGMTLCDYLKSIGPIEGVVHNVFEYKSHKAVNFAFYCASIEKASTIAFYNIPQEMIDIIVNDASLSFNRCNITRDNNNLFVNV